MNLNIFKKMALFLFGAIFFVALDRALKVYALINLQNKFYYLIKDLLIFRLAENKFIAFSLPLGGDILIIVNTIIIFLLFLFLFDLVKKEQYKTAGFLIILLFGAISNMFDRIKWGYVIDYFDLKYFTIFNVADMMIVGGIIGLIFMQIKKPQKKAEL